MMLYDAICQMIAMQSPFIDVFYPVLVAPPKKSAHSSDLNPEQ